MEWTCLRGEPAYNYVLQESQALDQVVTAVLDNSYRNATEAAVQHWQSSALTLITWCTQGRTVAPSLGGVPKACLAALADRDLDSLLYMATKVSSLRQSIYERVWRAQQAALSEAAAIFQEEGIDFILLKGADAFRWYNNEPVGMLNDVDVLVDRSALATVKRRMIQAGFRQARYDRQTASLQDFDLRHVAAAETQTPELAPLVRLEKFPLTEPERVELSTGKVGPIRLGDDEAQLIVSVDVHYQVALDVGNRGLFARAVPNHLGKGLRLSDSDAFWYLSGKYYNEVAHLNRSSLRHYAYIGPALAEGEIDWEVVSRACADFEMKIPLYYTLGFFQRLNPAVVPREVVASFRPGLHERGRDYGWQLSRIFGCDEPFPATVLPVASMGSSRNTDFV